MNETCKQASRGALFCGVAAFALLSGTALAQDDSSTAAAADAAQAGRQTSSLEQIVVTATRQTSTVNEVPLSVTAVTQRGLDQQGIHGIEDLQVTIPGLNINQALGTGLANVAIRGIHQGGQGAATTGFYLDDTPLQKRNVGGVTSGTANGTPLPPLFDLERVEVLRGPQGTLYGGSSEGGTIRYITPTPNLEDYSVYARASVFSNDYGGSSDTAGVAIGGPIVTGKLGFRASLYKEHTAGWLDYVDPFTQQVVAKDANSNDIKEFHGVLLWAPNDNLSLTLSYFGSETSSPDTEHAYTMPTTAPVVIPTQCFNTTGITPETHRVYPLPVGNSAEECAANPDVTYTREGANYGPYELDKFQVLGPAVFAKQPAKTTLDIPSLTLNYDFAGFSVRWINSYIKDDGRTAYTDTTLVHGGNLHGTYGSLRVPRGFVFLKQLPYSGYGNFVASNARKSVAEELRFNSAPGAGKLTWVAGLYYEDDKADAGFLNLYETGGVDGTSEALYGITGAQRWGSPAEPGPGNLDIFAIQAQKLHDRQIAVYGEVNYDVTNALQLTLGLRQSQVKFDYYQAHYGPVTGVLVPTFESGTESLGSTKENPFTPKLGLKYQIAGDKLVYFTSAKGFRPGGVNAQTSENICGPSMAQYGLPFTALPVDYKSDTDWSYEVGAKLGLLGGRVQLNSDIYRIDWKNVQATQSPGFGCGIQFTTNAGSARSQGIELEAQARIFAGLTAHLAYAYDDAEYTEDALAIHGPIRDLLVAVKGQKFALPAWTLNIGARYDFSAGDYHPYLRADWRSAAAYDVSTWPLGNYRPDSNHVPSSRLLNLRAGVDFGNYDLNLFLENVLNYSKGPLNGGRSGCQNEACTIYSDNNPIFSISSRQPRTIGLQFVYRH